MSDIGGDETSKPAELAFTILASLIFITVATIFLFPSSRWVPLDRRVAGLTGAFFCGVLSYIFSEQGIEIAEFIDLEVLQILIAIMAINYVMINQGIVSSWIHMLKLSIAEDVSASLTSSSTEGYENTGSRSAGFWWLSLVSFTASPFILNDGVCLLLPWPVLDGFGFVMQAVSGQSDRTEENRLNRLYYMLTICCSANIGSAMAFTGNPQNIIISEELSSLMSGGEFFLLMLLPATTSWLATTAYLNHSRIKSIQACQSMSRSSSLTSSSHPQFSSVSTMDESISPSLNHQSNNSHNDNESNINVSNNIIECDNSSSNSDIFQPSSNNRRLEYVYKDDDEANRDKCYDKDGCIEKGEMSIEEEDRCATKKVDRLTFSVADCPNLVFSIFMVLVALEFSGSLPLSTAFVMASILMVSCTLLVNHYMHWPAGFTVQQRVEAIDRYVEGLFSSVDYNLLWIFIGLFVVSGTLVKTGLPRTLWGSLALSDGAQDPKRAFTGFSGTACVLAYVAIASQLIGNVAVVIMAREQVSELPEERQKFVWLLLAWVSTVAGNLTLTGSAANIIVSEKAIRHKDFPTIIGAIEHFSICGPVTVLAIAGGASIIYLEARWAGFIAA